MYEEEISQFIAIFNILHTIMQEKCVRFYFRNIWPALALNCHPVFLNHVLDTYFISLLNWWKEKVKWNGLLFPKIIWIFLVVTKKLTEVSILRKEHLQFWKNPTFSHHFSFSIHKDMLVFENYSISATIGHSRQGQDSFVASKVAHFQFITSFTIPYLISQPLNESMK